MTKYYVMLFNVLMNEGEEASSTTSHIHVKRLTVSLAVETACHATSRNEISALNLTG